MPDKLQPPTEAEREAWAKDFTQNEQESLGLRPVTEGGMLYCGVEFQEYAIGGVTYAWPRSIKKLRWSLNFSRLGQISDMDFKDAATTWLKEITDCSDREYEYTSNPRLANVLYTVQRLDGRSSVLADAQIVMPSATPDTQLIVRFDDSEAWTLATTPGQGEIGLYPVGLHETLHTEGVGHKPPNVNRKALISPVYDPLIRNLQAADIEELVRRNGTPKVVTPPPSTPPIKGSVFTFGRDAELVTVTVDYPSEKAVSVKVDVQKGDLGQVLSGTKPLIPRAK